jgi:hypothetical protein
MRGMYRMGGAGGCGCGCGAGGRGHHGRHGRQFGGFHQPTVDDELKFWQERQRDLEEQLADVVERVRRLRKAGEGTSA